MLQHLIIQFSVSIVCQVVAYGRVIDKENVETFCSKSGRSRLQEVPNIVIQ